MARFQYNKFLENSGKPKKPPLLSKRMEDNRISFRIDEEEQINDTLWQYGDGNYGTAGFKMKSGRFAKGTRIAAAWSDKQFTSWVESFHLIPIREEFVFSVDGSTIEADFDLDLVLPNWVMVYYYDDYSWNFPEYPSSPYPVFEFPDFDPDIPAFDPDIPEFDPNTPPDIPVNPPEDDPDGPPDTESNPPVDEPPDDTDVVTEIPEGTDVPLLAITLSPKATRHNTPEVPLVFTVSMLNFNGATEPVDYDMLVPLRVMGSGAAGTDYELSGIIPSSAFGDGPASRFDVGAFALIPRGQTSVDVTVTPLNPANQDTVDITLEVMPLFAFTKNFNPIDNPDIGSPEGTNPLDVSTVPDVEALQTGYLTPSLLTANYTFEPAGEGNGGDDLDLEDRVPESDECRGTSQSAPYVPEKGFYLGTLKTQVIASGDIEAYPSTTATLSLVPQDPDATQYWDLGDPVNLQVSTVDGVKTVTVNVTAGAVNNDEGIVHEGSIPIVTSDPFKPTNINIVPSESGKENERISGAQQPGMPGYRPSPTGSNPTTLGTTPGAPSKYSFNSPPLWDYQVSFPSNAPPGAFIKPSVGVDAIKSNPYPPSVIRFPSARDVNVPAQVWTDSKISALPLEPLACLNYQLQIFLELYSTYPNDDPEDTTVRIPEGHEDPLQIIIRIVLLGDVREDYSSEEMPLAVSLAGSATPDTDYTILGEGQTPISGTEVLADYQFSENVLGVYVPAGVLNAQLKEVTIQVPVAILLDEEEEEDETIEVTPLFPEQPEEGSTPLILWESYETTIAIILGQIKEVIDDILYNFKVLQMLQGGAKLEGFGQDLTIELPDIITVDIPGVEIPQVDVFGPEYFYGPEPQVDVFGPEYLSPDGQDYRYTVLYDPPSNETGINTYYQYYDSNGNKLGVGGEENSDGYIDLSLQSTYDYVNNAFDEWYEQNTRTPLSLYRYTVLYDPPSNDTGVNTYYQYYNENGVKEGVGGEENSDGYIDLSLQSTYEYVNNAFDEWYQANTGEPITDAVEVTGNAATYTFPQDSELYVCYVYLQLRDAPLGSSITANVYNTSLPGSPTILDSILTVPAGQTRSNPVTLDRTIFNQGDVLQVAILSVGSEFPGAGMQLFLGRKYGEGEEIDWERVGLTNTGNGYVALFKKENDYIYMGEDGVIKTTRFTPSLFVENTIPSLSYVGKEFWYWRKLLPQKENVRGSGGGFYSPWVDIHANFSFHGLSSNVPASVHKMPSPVNYNTWGQSIVPTLKFTSYVTTSDVYGAQLSSDFEGNQATTSWDYVLGDKTETLNSSLTTSRTSTPNNTLSSQNVSHDWSSTYPIGYEFGENEIPTFTIYDFVASGTGSSSINNTWATYGPDSWGAFYYAFSGQSISSSYTSSGLISQNEDVVLSFSYNGTHSFNSQIKGYYMFESSFESWFNRQTSASKEEIHERNERTQNYIHFKNDVIEWTYEKRIHTKLKLDYTRTIDEVANGPAGEIDIEQYDNPAGNPVFDYTTTDTAECTLTENVYLYSRPLVSIKTLSNTYFLSSYSNNVYTPCTCFYVITNGGLNITSISGNFQDTYANYTKIVEQRIAKLGYQKTNVVSYTEEESFTHKQQNIINENTVFDIYEKSDLNSEKQTASISFNKSLDTNDNEEDYYTYYSVSFSEQGSKSKEYFALLDNYPSGYYCFVPSEDYTEVVWELLKTKDRANIYVIASEQGNQAIELAISEQKPSNNNFGGAVLLEGQNVSVRGNNYGADWQGTLSEPSLSPPTQSVWYKWVAPSSTPVTIHTLGSPVAADYQVDTFIAVYTGSSLNSLSLVASNDDASVELPPNGDYLSAVVINPTEGTTYYIQVDGYSDTQWSFVLSITTEGLNVPTPIQEETRRADIYRFDTQTLKWKRMPNAVSAISPLTGASDFISYHATPQTETLTDGFICPEE